MIWLYLSWQGYRYHSSWAGRYRCTSRTQISVGTNHSNSLTRGLSTFPSLPCSRQVQLRLFQCCYVTILRSKVQVKSKKVLLFTCNGVKKLPSTFTCNEVGFWDGTCTFTPLLVWQLSRYKLLSGNMILTIFNHSSVNAARRPRPTQRLYSIWWWYWYPLLSVTMYGTQGSVLGRAALDDRRSGSPAIKPSTGKPAVDVIASNCCSLEDDAGRWSL